MSNPILLSDLIKQHLDEKSLNEGLETSYPADFIVDYLNKQLSSGKFSIGNKIRDNFEKKNPKGIIWHTNSPSTEKLERIETQLKLFGWYFSSFTQLSINPTSNRFSDYPKEEIKDVVDFIIEPKYDIELSYQDLSSVMYHVIPNQNKEKIEKIGLIPKTKEKVSNHPDRIYFSPKKSDIDVLLKTKKFTEDNKIFSIFQFNCHDFLKKHPNRKFMIDPNFKNSIYSVDNISPIFLKFEKDVKI